MRETGTKLLIALIGSVFIMTRAGQASGDESRKDNLPNLIVVENALSGATDWQLTRVRVDNGRFRSTWIEGYCSKQSIKAGESIDIMVSTNPLQPFEIEVFRMGY